MSSLTFITGPCRQLPVQPAPGVAESHPSAQSRHHTARAALTASAGTERELEVHGFGCAGALGMGLCLAARGRGRRHYRGRSAAAPLRVATIDEAVLAKVAEGVYERSDIRNLAIIAHVDHGKTTLTDALMTQCGDLKKDVSMDSNALEMERGITILAKNAAINYKDVKINLIDTPGHADFGGEVERILNMADGCLLLVDAQEGPMPQTKFVLQKALELSKRTIVVINKVDKPASRPDWVLDTTFDLFAALGADDDLCDFPVCYASGIQGKAGLDHTDGLTENLDPLIEQILEECPKPKVQPDEPLQMLVANLDYCDYMGRICIGRVTSGGLKVGQTIGLQYGPEGEVRKGSISKLWEFNNNERVETQEISAGDICAFSGLDDVSIGDTVVDTANPKALPPIIVEEPTVVMEFGVNRSPYAGRLKSSTGLTSSDIQKRLEKECLTNLALRLEPGSSADSFKVKGRGTLQLGILMENMRREGYEFMVAAPEVLYREDPDTGKKQEPYEEVVVDVPSQFMEAVMAEFNKKAGALMTMEAGSMENSQVLQFSITTANMIGMQGKMLAKTKGQAVLTSRFSHWGDVLEGGKKLRDKGPIITTATGKATTFALQKIAERGTLFINTGDDVFEGMCIGLHSKAQSLECNITKEKGGSNMRAVGATAAKAKGLAQMVMSIDDYLGHMDRDELLEVTPGPLRLCRRDSKALKRK